SNRLIYIYKITIKRHLSGGERIRLKLKKVDSYEKKENKVKNKEKVLSKIEKLENEIKEIDFVMTNNQSDYETHNKLYERKEALSDELESVMELWVSLEE